MPEARVTDEQLGQLSHMLRPVIAKLLKESVSDTQVKITCVPVEEGHDVASRLRFQIQVRGVDIPPEKEAEVTQFLASGSAEKVMGG